MSLGDAIRARCGAAMRLLLALALLGGSAQALAEDCVADLGGVLDGNVTPVAPANINIDGVCRIMNYPNGMSTNFSGRPVRRSKIPSPDCPGDDRSPKPMSP